MGYDSLVCCAYLYGDVETAYENMGRVSDTRKALEDFVSGKAEAVEYVDFDNDGEDELILHGYAGARFYLDVVGDTVYKVLKTGSTTDVSYPAEMEGKRVVMRTDLTHGGRQYYWGMTYDGCGCLTDWFRLCVSYEGTDYGAEDSFEYRDRVISMEEFETIRNGIHDL